MVLPSDCSSDMQTLDYLVVAVYLGIIIGFGVFFGRNQSRQEFFHAGGSMGWFVVGLSVMATLFSSNSFVFFPSAAFGDSLKLGMCLVSFTVMTPIVIYIFIPIYARLEVETAYEYLERRYHVAVRTLASALFILLRIGWLVSMTHAASLVVAEVSGFSQTTVIVVLGGHLGRLYHAGWPPRRNVDGRVAVLRFRGHDHRGAAPDPLEREHNGW